MPSMYNSGYPFPPPPAPELVKSTPSNVAPTTRLITGNDTPANSYKIDSRQEICKIIPQVLNQKTKNAEQRESKGTIDTAPINRAYDNSQNVTVTVDRLGQITASAFSSALSCTSSDSSETSI
mmetsp:Transcript_26140/g.32063  ORF Transcript_26140/g.32063 Transcript_26140/m.32063 type:complete len:123 (+) Transcript_26140:158-526(+)